MTTQSNQKAVSVEKWLQHVVQAVSVTAVIGGAVLLTDLRTSIAVVSVEMKVLNQRLEELRQTTLTDRYSATQAAKDLEQVMRRVDDHEERIRFIEMQDRGL